MSNKGNDKTIKYEDIIVSPPPSYASTLSSSDNNDQPSSSQHVAESYYQAYPIGSRTQQHSYAPFTDIYLAPSEVVSGANNPSVLVYVMDEVKDNDTPRHTGIPMATICFIFGICTWIGFIPGIFYLKSKDPRERWWARACAMMCILWTLIIISAMTFGGSYRHYRYYNDGNYYDAGYK